MSRVAPPPAPGTEPETFAAPRARRAALAGIAVLVAITALAGPGAVLLGADAPPPAAGVGPPPVLAVAPPWAEPSDIVARAGGRVVSPLGAPLAVLASGPGPDFPARLKAAGAWFALDGRRIAQLCGAAG